MPRIGEILGGVKDFAEGEFRKHTFKSSVIALLGGFTIKHLYHEAERIEVALIDKRDEWLWAREDRANGTPPDMAEFEAELVPELAGQRSD